MGFTRMLYVLVQQPQIELGCFNGHKSHDLHLPSLIMKRSSWQPMVYQYRTLGRVSFYNEHTLHYMESPIFSRVHSGVQNTPSNSTALNILINRCLRLPCTFLLAPQLNQLGFLPTAHRKSTTGNISMRTFAKRKQVLKLIFMHIFCSIKTRFSLFELLTSLINNSENLQSCFPSSDYLDRSMYWVNSI